MGIGIKRAGAVAVALLVLMPSAGFALDELGLAGTVPPGPGGRHRNPALTSGVPDLRLGSSGRDGGRGRVDAESAAGWTMSLLGAVRLPTGLLGLLRPGSNPFLYSSDRGAFIASFDALSFLDQAAQPGLFLLDPPQSPEQVLISVSSQEISVTGGNGESIPLGMRPGTHGISVFATPLVPPPSIGIGLRYGPLALESGLFWGGGDYALTPNEALQEVLDGGPVGGFTEYSVTAAASAQAGLSQSVTLLYRLPWGCPSWRIQGAVRAVLFYAAAAGRVELRGGTRTGAGGLPETVFAQSDLFYFYPGTGFGTGARIDAGLAALHDRLLLGLGVLNILGVSRYTGMRRGLEELFIGEPTQDSMDFAGSLPELSVHAAWSAAVGPAGSLTLMADVGYPRTLAAHCAAAYRQGKVLVESGIGWEGALRYDVSIGVLMARWFAEMDLSARQALFSGDIVHGLGLSIGRYGGRYERW
jgi:hypothetical protein